MTSLTSSKVANTDRSVTGPRWSGTTWTGIGERPDYQYVTVTLQTDVSGVLHFEFSIDGATWSQFPVAGFDVSAGINEYHSAHKSMRWFRARFVGDGAPTYYRIQTDFTNSQVTLNSPLNQGVSADSDAATVKAVSFGQQPDGDHVGAAADGTAWSEANPLGIAGVFTSGWTDSDGYATISVFFSSDVVSANEGVMVEYTDDVQAATPTVRAAQVFTFVPEDITRGFRTLLLPVLLDGFRIKYTNGATAQTAFYVQADLRTQAASVFSVLVGEDANNPGARVLVKTTEDGALVTSTDSSIINFVYDAYNKNIVSTLIDRFDYFTGGLAGTKVAEIEVIYTDTSKTDIVSTERTNV